MFEDVAVVHEGRIGWSRLVEPDQKIDGPVDQHGVFPTRIVPLRRSAILGQDLKLDAMHMEGGVHHHIRTYRPTLDGTPPSYMEVDISHVICIAVD